MNRRVICFWFKSLHKKIILYKILKYYKIFLKWFHCNRLRTLKFFKTTLLSGSYQQGNLQNRMVIHLLLTKQKPPIPWFVDNSLYCFHQLLGIHCLVIHSYSKSKILYFLSIRRLISKQGNSHHRDTMVCWLIKTMLSHMGDKSFDVLVSQQIILR